MQSETVSGVDEKLLMTNRSGRGRQFSAPAAILALLGFPVTKAGLRHTSVIVWIKARRSSQPTIVHFAALGTPGSDSSLFGGDRSSWCGRQQPTPFLRQSARNCNDLRSILRSLARPRDWRTLAQG